MNLIRINKMDKKNVFDCAEIAPSKKQSFKIIVRKTFILLFASIAFVACQSRDTKQSETKVENHQHDEASTADMLTLNNGAKWKADSVTTQNVANLKNIIENLKPSDLNSYHDAAAKLQEGINKMISECKMKGDDHEALHHWLEPLMEQNKELTEAKEIEKAGEIFKSISARINLYDKFFEQSNQ